MAEPEILVDRHSRDYNPYSRGTRFEYRTREYLRGFGWFVIRQPRSAFPDLVALKNGVILFVECKLHGYMPSAERRHIVRLARNHIKAKALLALKKEGRLLLYEISRRSARFDRCFDPRTEQTCPTESRSS